MVVEKIKAMDLSMGNKQLFTVTAGFILIVFLSGWLGREFVVEALGAATKEELKVHIASVERTSEASKKEMRAEIKELSNTTEQISIVQIEHIKEFRMDSAIRMLRGYQSELVQHMAQERNTPDWVAIKRKLEERVQLATDYKECVAHTRPNCELLQRQLWQ